MPRREYNVWKRCNEPGCKERTFYTCTTQKNRIKLDREPWTCLRHDYPNEVLSASNKKITVETEYVSGKSKKYPNLNDLFWGNGSGFVHGDNWRAWAEDFPIGTKIKMNMNVELFLPTQPKQKVKEDK